MLINSTHPEIWMQEQEQTCHHLQTKLDSIYSKENDVAKKGNL